MKALKITWKLRRFLMVSQSAVEPVVVNTRYLSMVLFARNKLNATVKIDETNFKLPIYEETLYAEGANGTNLTCKVVLFKINPYNWHISAARGELLVYLSLKVLTRWVSRKFS